VSAHEEIKAEEDKKFHEMEEKHQNDIKLLQQAIVEQKKEQVQMINRLLSLLIKEAIEGKTVFGKKTFKSLINGESSSLSLYTTDCDYNDPMFFNALAKDLLPVKKALEEKDGKVVTGSS
jgi:hypothetical protein